MTEQTATTSKPTHRIYIVVGEGKKAKWTEIAAAWPHSDGKGYGINEVVPPSWTVWRRS